MISKYYNFFKTSLYPINRSITGKGTKLSLLLIKKLIPELRLKKFKSGTKTFDWKIPAEWNVNKAYVEDLNKKKIIDFQNHNLHLVGYSKKIKKFITKKQLKKKIYYLRNQPKAIPYVTSYYKKDWGFCVDYQFFKKFNKTYRDNEKFFVCIDSNFKKKGYLNYGECLIKGRSKKEILISTYICHPSMANNELSGPLLSVLLMNFFKKRKLYYSLRFLFIPETIGSISYLHKNLKNLKKKVIGGYNLTCVGDTRMYSCIFSKYGNSPSDFALKETFKELNINYKVHSFLERGSDERQYNSPGIDLKITTVCRSKFGTYPEYHTSLDDFNLVTKKGISESFKLLKKTILNLNKKILPESRYLCEPNLGKRNMYNTLSMKRNNYSSKYYLSFLQYSDGNNDLKSIAQYLNISFKKTKSIFMLLQKKKLLRGN